MTSWIFPRSTLLAAALLLSCAQGKGLHLTDDGGFADQGTFPDTRPPDSGIDRGRDRAISPDRAIAPDWAMAPDQGPLAGSRDGAEAGTNGPDLGTTKPDSVVDGPAGPPNIGAPCSGSQPCTGGATCRLSLRGIGICTMPCTRDDSATTANEDTCPDLAVNTCGEVQLTTGPANYCLRKCAPDSARNDCLAPFACEPGAGSITGQAELGVCLDVACKVDADCPVFTDKICVVATGNGCDSAKGERCVDTGSGGKCALGGSCNTQSGMCEGHQLGKADATVGAACNSDLECGNNMFCLVERKVDGQTQWRNGYCTIFACAFADAVPAFACPTGAHCNRAYFASNGFCQKACSVTASGDCRGNAADKFGDYECYSWDTFTIGSKQISDGPVCGPPIACDLLAYNCSAVGDTGNPTTMSCRTTQNTTLSNPRDPAGFCLDSTASGPVP